MCWSFSFSIFIDRLQVIQTLPWSRKEINNCRLKCLLKRLDLDCPQIWLAYSYKVWIKQWIMRLRCFVISCFLFLAKDYYYFCFPSIKTEFVITNPLTTEIFLTEVKNHWQGHCLQVSWYFKRFFGQLKVGIICKVV